MSSPVALYNFNMCKIKIDFHDVPLESISDGSVPRGRSGHRIVANHKYIYSLGGYNPFCGDFEEDLNDASNGPLFREMWRFNIGSKEWVMLNIPRSSFPNELASIVAEMSGDIIFLHGGTGVPFGVSKSCSTYVVNPAKESLTLFETYGAVPDPMYGQGSFLDPKNQMLYVVGGTSGLDFSIDVHSLDLSSGQWMKYDCSNRNHPPGRYRHEIAVHDSKIIVFGGGTIRQVFSFEELPAFNLKTGQWEKFWTKEFTCTVNQRRQRGQYPAPRRCHVGAMVPGMDGRDPYFVICGGFNGERLFNDIWWLNLNTKRWYKWKSSLPSSLYFHDGALTPQGKLLIFGGITSTSRIVDDALARSNQVLSCWVRIPKLCEMAWEALLYYAPNLSKRKSLDLIRLGIPRPFVNRLQ